MKTVLDVPLIAPQTSKPYQEPVLRRSFSNGNAGFAFETKGRNDSRGSLENILSMVAILGDFSMIALGFILANLLCQINFVPAWLGLEHAPSLSTSCKLISLSSLIIVWRLTGKNLYSYDSLLAPSSIWHKLLEVLSFCLLAFIGITQVARSDLSIHWMFFVFVAFLAFLNIYAWRLGLSQIIQHSTLFSRLSRRLVVIGGGPQTMRIQKELGGNSGIKFVGWVQAIKPNQIKELESYCLGPLYELENVLRQEAIDIAILTESESLQREGVLAVARACENEHVQFKMVPHFFETLISGLRPEIIGGTPLLGVDCLPLNGLRNRFVKRTIDILGALVGLTLSVPLICIFGALVYQESPGSIFYKQLRQGRKGRLFYIFKIRSMHLGAEANGKAQWARANDRRRLRVGTLMRKWNIDEVPQFWNVLIGQMSLVGPRPERPELIARFKSKIPHYQIRHKYLPGITGWAQVNGLRGDTDLEERIRHDIWYLENWSIWLDLRILIRTFFCNKNAY